MRLCHYIAIGGFVVEFEDILELLYKRRLLGKVSHQDVKQYFPNARMTSDYIACVSRARSLGLSTDEFSLLCHGVEVVQDDALLGSLRRVFAENNVEFKEV